MYTSSRYRLKIYNQSKRNNKAEAHLVCTQVSYLLKGMWLSETTGSAKGKGEGSSTPSNVSLKINMVKMVKAISNI